VIDFLKDYVSLFNGLLILVLVAVALRIGKKVKASNFIFYFSVFIFLCFSTGYIPIFLVSKIESKYKVLDSSLMKSKSQDSLFIVVLASGYTIDSRFPAIDQLDVNSLVRLAEGVRVKKLCKRCTLVCSGYSSLGLETQASVTKKAAIELGVEKNEIATLDRAGSTMEEAAEFKKKYGSKAKLILVTDAFHMPRAIKLFNTAGISNIIPAPTNFRAKKKLKNRDYLPSMGNLSLSEIVLHEYLGELKYLLHYCPTKIFKGRPF
jgi:uncharacterized SAM-binding protein YcdF (DUF218 family)